MNRTTYDPHTLATQDKNDEILFKGDTSPKRNATTASSPKLQRQSLRIDVSREYEAAGKSYQVVRTTIATLYERQHERQIAQQEAFVREQQGNKLKTQFTETRLATCGIPTLNTMNVRLERRRERAKASNEQVEASKVLTDKTLRQGAHRKDLDMQIRAAVRRSYGSQELDLMSLELVQVPQAAMSTTLVRQLARLIRTLNVSRNALRDLPDAFIATFPELETFNCKENALTRLPAQEVGKLRYLRILNIAGNQVEQLPASLPNTLETLDASRNRLQDVQNLHTLTRLVSLDLSSNQFYLLPCGFFALTRLETLSLASNRLVTLALRPQWRNNLQSSGESASENDDNVDEAQEDQDEAAQKQWRIEIDPATHDSVYYNVKSKELTRFKPQCFQVRIPKLPLRGNQALQQANGASYKRFPDGWEIVTSSLSDTPRALQFINHCTGDVLSVLPPALDRWESFDHLQTLLVSNNELVNLPLSIGKLKRLKRLEAENNKLVALPDVLQGLVMLETLKLGMNRLTVLPPSFSKLANITDVDLKLNRLRELPEHLGDLQQLQVLDASANALEKLPHSFLALQRLTTLRIFGNPSLMTAGFTAEALGTGNLAQVRWQVEHEMECEKHNGLSPPEPHLRLVGVGTECWSTDLHINREFTRAVELAQATHKLSMHWRGMKVQELPRVFFTALTDLTELRLSGQHFEVLSAKFGAFTKLRVLQLRENGIRFIAPEVFTLTKTFDIAIQHVDALTMGIGRSLETLDLRYNRLTSLPGTLVNCRKLQVLQASHNLLQVLPESMDGLAENLIDVELAHNQIVRGPRALTALYALERLDLSFNRLETLDELDFSQLTRLQVLRLSGNRLQELPMSLGGVGVSGKGTPPPIRELSFAGNRLQDFPPAVLLLGDTLQRLEMQSNRLEQLPMSFGTALSSLKLIESDGNPFRSPPAEIMRLGAKDISLYLLKRQERIQELEALLSGLGLVFDRHVFDKPIVRHVLSSPSTKFPFLTSKHLEAFDEAVDSYVNGAFYLPPPPLGTGPRFHRGVDIFHKVLLCTHYALAQRHHRLVLEELLQLLTIIRQKRWADKSDLRYDMLRPWGRRGELVGVYMVRASLLFPEVAQENVRTSERILPSIFRVITARTQRGFPPEPFIRNKRTLSDVERALDQYKGPYGPVGVAHGNVPMRCECQELLQFDKMHDPCPQRGWTMVRVLYTHEEAARRQVDEEQLREAKDTLLPQIRAFLATPDGEKRFQCDVKVAKDELRARLRVLEKQLVRHRAKWQSLAKAHASDEKLAKKRKRSAEKAAKAKKPGERMIRMEAPETLRELKVRMAKQEKLVFAETRVREDIEELERGRARLGQGHAAFREEVERALVEKTGATVRRHLLRQQRDKAIAMGWRRPWDGIDGRAFTRYYRDILRHKYGDDAEGGAVIDDLKGGLKLQMKAKGAGDEMEDKEDEDAVASDDNSEVSDVSYDGYDDLAVNLARESLNAAQSEDEEEDLDGISQDDDDILHDSEDSDL